MKRFSVLLLVVVFIASLTACENNVSDNNSSLIDTTISGFINLDSKNGASGDKTNNSDNSDTSSKNSASGDVSDNSNSSSGKVSDASENSDSNSSNNNSDNGNSSPSGTSSKNSSAESTASDTDDEYEYKKISCRNVGNNEWKTVQITLNGSKMIIQLSIPQNWNIENGKILKNGSEIGVISRKTPADSANTYEIFSKTESTFRFRKTVEEYSSNGKNHYKRLFKITNYTETVGKLLFYISVDYSELDDSAATKLLNSFSYIGTERKMPEIKNDSKKFLILGNSFIGSSQIADFLSDMLITDGSNYVVETRVKGGAEVRAFAEDTALIEEIASGEFAYVFQCCFYSNDTIDALQTILDACEKSNTGLIVLPAHNEPIAVVNRVLEKYTDLYCINWKTEIDNLIASGIGTNSPSSLTESDFCENDYYGHSTALAGYVGAHMIYRNVFGTIPPSLSDTAPLSMSEIDLKLLNYSSDGLVPGQSEIYSYVI